MNFYNYIQNDSTIFAHTKETNYETIFEHAKLTKYYYDFIVKTKNLNTIIDNMIDIISPNKSLNNYIKEMFQNAIEWHDIGKSQTFFQAKIQKKFVTSNITDEHSIFSSYIYLCYYLKDIKENIDRKDRFYINKIAYAFAYIISKHHSHLDNDFLNLNKNDENFKQKLNNINTLVEENPIYLSNLKDLPIYKENCFKLIEKIEFYILCKLLYSLTIASDYYATTKFMNNIDINDLGVFDDNLKNTFINKFEDNNIIKNIRTNNNSLPINKLRSEIFLETEENLIDNINNSLFFFKSPTGSGKTISSLNLTLNILKHSNINKIFYVFPYNTLVDQTTKTINNIFTNLNQHISTINSLTPIKENVDNNNINYINKININYPFNIISHVGLFNILFGTNKNNSLPLYTLCNSVIVLDEIQAYSINLWKEIINLFDVFAKCLNIKFIIMSATLPKFSILNDSDTNIINLLPNSDKYFNNDIFKKRVSINFDLLQNPKSLDDIVSFLDDNYLSFNKILIEFQDRTHCRDFYNKINNKYNDYKIIELTSFDNRFYKEKVINLLSKKDEKIILISTQIIEAGVDIDMDLGIKEISCLESEEQFLGRINRSCTKNNCYAYFFQLKDSKVKFIFKEDFRIKRNLTINKKLIQNYLLNKNFDEYYNFVLSELNENKKNSLNNYNEFLKNIYTLNFRNIKEHMELIEDNTISIYIPSIINNINGLDIWKEYINIVTDYTMEFCERKIKLSKLSPIMNYFTYNIFNNNNFNLNKKGIEYINGLYFIENGKDFINNKDKLNYIELKNWLQN